MGDRLGSWGVTDGIRANYQPEMCPLLTLTSKAKLLSHKREITDRGISWENKRPFSPAAAVSNFVLVLRVHDLIVVVVVVVVVGGEEEEAYNSAVGDPGMRRDGLRVAWEAWNFCNEVGAEAPLMGSPRGADCFDLLQDESGGSGDKVVHRVSEKDNKLSVGDPFPARRKRKRASRTSTSTRPRRRCTWARSARWTTTRRGNSG
uniref:DUF7705 domain-containing protein n=1 Tax=Ananas comosus var. bracteatus TaxID=296719 RepID=A0A6V7QHR3_ANACO|nr:unnamed protein product [Ananas comosus var. bracteatus]